MGRVDEGKQWLLELTQNITNQLKEDRADINLLWETVRKDKELHMTCREQILEKLAELDRKLLEKANDIDKRLEITIVKMGALITALSIMAEYLFSHLMGK